MLITGTEDLRVQKTMTAISEAFVCLVLECDYTKISLKDVCERAKINKKTFYRYYPTLHDLFCETLEKLSLGYLERISGCTLPDDLKYINREFFTYAVEQGALYEKLLCHGSYNTYGKAMLGDLVRRAWQTSEIFTTMDFYRQNILLCFLQNTGTELYRQWIVDGKSIPLEEIINLSESLLCHGVHGFIQIMAQPPSSP